MPAIKFNIGNILKAYKNEKGVDLFDLNTPEGRDLSSRYYAKASFIVNKNPDIHRYIDTINTNLGDESLYPTIKNNIKSIFALDKEALREGYLNINSELKSREFASNLTVPNLNDKQNLRNSRVFLKQSLRFFEHAFKQGFRRYEQSMLKSLKKT